jgi:hypothetical protein
MAWPNLACVAEFRYVPSFIRMESGSWSKAGAAADILDAAPPAATTAPPAAAPPAGSAAAAGAANILKGGIGVVKYTKFSISKQYNIILGLEWDYCT